MKLLRYSRKLLPLRSFSSEQFVNATSKTYISDMYDAYSKDPASVHLSWYFLTNNWQIYFRNINNGVKQNYSPPSLSMPLAGETVQNFDSKALPANDILDTMKVQLLTRAYQIRGHQLADLDPLHINFTNITNAPELSIEHYGFTEADLSREFHLGAGILPRFMEGKEKRTLGDILQMLKDTYCGSIGIEYGHLNDRTQCEWLRQKFEVPVKYKYNKEQKIAILDRLMWSDHFEQFVSKKFPSEKRFGLEGCETLIPGMKALIDSSVELGAKKMVLGMPHRGRLNVLSNVVRKPNESIFSEFSGSKDNTVEGSGDVKYHLGMTFIRPTPSGKTVELSLVANPSHLEAANPVVEGKVRAIQFFAGDEAKRSTAIPVLLHGDAAFSGQGVVYETLGMTDLPAYTTGGTIHLVVNNQVGFTTDPRFSRSTPYCSDVAKTISAPVLHVNGDDTEAVVFCCELASEWRAKFNTDVVVDIVCYRKYGHNEIDQPGFTQPLMYERIAKITPVLAKYTQKLISEGTITQDEVDLMDSRIYGILEENYEASQTYQSESHDWMSSNWVGFKSPSELAKDTVKSIPTGIDVDLLRHIGITGSTYPSDFNIHPNLGRVLKLRGKTINDGQGIDWATAESMAFGSLLSEGNHIRLSGQDVERGTFSHRHALLNDQKTELRYVPLNHIVKPGLVEEQSVFTVCNSSLSEFGVLGFELGYSIVSPNQLVLWEAQFGDFANNAQCIIDQFICSGEQKWLQRTGLTMLLPHGYDGQGPEHSSARLERMLQLCDEDPYVFPDVISEGKGSAARQHQACNMQVVYPTVPSNYFHVLRRQVHREFRKPLVVFVSKALLRHPFAKSALSEMGPGTRFQRVIPEVMHPSPFTEIVVAAQKSTSSSIYSGNNLVPQIPTSLQTSDKFELAPVSEIKTVIFCSGQVYYLLYRARAMNNLKNIAIVRLEQLNPFPFLEVKAVVDFYAGSLEEIVWCQEESFNSGAWSHVDSRLDTSIRASNWFTNNEKSSVFASGGPSKGKQWQDKLDLTRRPGGLGNAKDSTHKESIRGSRLVRYAGRDISAAPATGIKKQHKFEEICFVSEALFGGKLHYPPTKMDEAIPIF